MISISRWPSPRNTRLWPSTSPASTPPSEELARERLIGRLGGIPPRENVRSGETGKCLPIQNDGREEELVCHSRHRVWLWRNVTFLGGGPLGATRIGDASLLNQWRSLYASEIFRTVSAQNILLLEYLLAGFAGLGLFLFAPGEREYLWFAATEIASAALCGWVGFQAVP